MKKKILMRTLHGFPVGILIGYLITILISIVWGKGRYTACNPDFISVMGNEINAIILQSILCGILGSGFAASSVIWELERWSVAKQSTINFLILSVIMMPMAYLLHWMEHTWIGFLSYYGIFALIFIAIWVFMFLCGKYNVTKINENLNKVKF